MRLWVVLVVACLSLVGCRPRDPLSRVVFVSACDFVVTAKDAKDAAEFLAEIQSVAGSPIKERSRARWINRTAMRVVPSLVTTGLMEREFARCGLKPTKSAAAAVLSRWRASLRRPNATVDEIAEAFGRFGAYFRRQFERECRLEQYLMGCDGINPTDEDIEIVEAQLKRQIAKNEVEDERARKRGEEAWKRLHDGESWDVVAKSYSEDKLLYGDDCDYAHEWETVAPACFYLKEIADTLPGMKAGEFTRPIETDEGLLIVRVQKVTDEGQYRCVRIMIRLKVKVELPGPDELRRRLTKENREQAQIDLSRRLRKGIKFEYPLGTNFTYKVVEETAKAKRSTENCREHNHGGGRHREQKQENGNENRK